MQFLLLETDGIIVKTSISLSMSSGNLVFRLSLLFLTRSLVAEGHVTTQNLGGKKNLLGLRGSRVF